MFTRIRFERTKLIRQIITLQNSIQIAIISGLFVLAIIFIRSQIWLTVQTGCSGFRKNGRSGSTGHFASTEFTVEQTDRDDITLLR